MSDETPRSPSAMQAEFWDGEGGRRWAASQQQLDAMLAPFADAIFDAANLASDEVVVDVGCGCGTTTLRAARLVEPTCTGIDISRPMLEVARRTAEGAGLDVTFLCADAATHPFGDHSAHVVLSRFGTMFFDDPLAAFTNFRHWLRPGGRLVATVWNALEVNPWARALSDIIGRHVDLPRPPPGAPGPFAFGDAEAFAATLERAGFENVEQRALSIPMRVEGTADEVLQFFKERGPVTSALEQLGDGPVYDAILRDLDTFVVEAYDGQGASLDSSARLVVAT
ncbi:MAG: class I SAM-dependent methyltransferase [Myxococcota bacterium]